VVFTAGGSGKCGLRHRLDIWTLGAIGLHVHPLEGIIDKQEHEHGCMNMQEA